MEQSNPQGAIVAFRNALEKDQNFIDARYQLAKAYMEMERYDLAEQELRKVQLQNPNYPGLGLDMARIFLNTNRLEQAGYETGRYMEAQSMSAEALIILGEIQGRLGDLEDAQRSFQEALQMEPGMPAAHLGLGKTFLLQNKHDQAGQELNKALETDPDNLEALGAMAELQRRHGETEALLVTYEKIINLNPQDAETLYEKGVLHLRKGELDEVRSIAERLERRFSNRSEGYRLSGLHHFQEGNFREAVVSLQQANSIRPSLSGHYFLGLSLHQQGELESALSQFRIILDQIPEFTQARLMTGLILMQQQRLDLAEREIQRVLGQEPQNAMAYNMMGSLQMAMGNYDQGMQLLQKATELDPGLANAFLMQGVFHLDKGKISDATANLDAAIRVAPEQLNIRMLQFANLMQQGELEKAYATLEEGLTGKVGDAALLNNMAAVRLAQNRTEEGLELLEKSKITDPRFASAYFNLASFYQTQGKLDEALSEYQAMLAHHPDNIRALLSAAGISMQLGQEEQAQEYFVKAQQTGDPQAYLSHAEFAVRNGQPEQAKLILDEGIASISDNLSLMEVKARILIAQGLLDEAIALHREIKSRQREGGIRLLAQSLLLKGDVQGALAEARELIKIHPDKAEGYLLLAGIHEATANPDQAEESIQAAIQIEPRNPQTHFRLGSLKAREGSFEEAMRAFSRSLELNPHFIPALFSSGSLLENQGEIDQAKEKYRLVLQIDPNHVPALNNVAYLSLKGHGNPEEALLLATQAFRLEQHNPGVMDTLGLALLQNNKPEEGRRILERAVQLLPNHPTIRYHLALAYSMTGEREKALNELNVALMNEEFPELQEARALNQKLTGTN
ncbi:PEP-CTERM system TPR-repeat protein PrsT [Desulfonatronum parangueonense]